MASTIVLITGANSGVGYATAKVLAHASESFHVIMAGRSQEKIEAAKTEIEQTAQPKGSISTVLLDVTDSNSIEKAARSVEQQFGRLDVLINNAGVGGLGLDVRTGYQRCMETNVIGPALVSEAFRPLLLKSQDPYSIFVSSGARTLTRNATQEPVGHGNIQNRGSAGGAYQVSKAALNMLALVEYRDYAKKGLKVFVVSPGFVRSNIRGTDEDAKSGWGKAGDPDASGGIILAIVQGKRDKDVGSFVHQDGVFPW